MKLKKYYFADKIDYASSDEFIRSYYRDVYDAIKYTNKGIEPQREQLGYEYHDLKTDIHYAKKQRTR